MSRQLVADYGRGYTEKNLRRMIQSLVSVGRRKQRFPSRRINKLYASPSYHPVQASKFPAAKNFGIREDTIRAGKFLPTLLLLLN
jgi:hypothetical protein